MDRPIAVKKIKPYPFDATISKEGSATPVLVHILKITPVGFIAKVTKDMFIVANTHQAEFKLPSSSEKLVEPVKVIKTYDSMEKQESGLGKVYMAEFHFTQFKAHTKGMILAFMKNIGQSK